MMNAEEWKKGLSAWKNVKKQAEIDLQQTDLIIPLFEQKIKELEEEEHGKRSTASNDTDAVS
jgi:hypothetical protein